MDMKMELLQRDKHELMRLLAAVVDKAGGEVLLTPQDLAISRTIERTEVAFTGVVRLRSERK